MSINVTSATYKADPTGVKDSTAAINGAITAAMLTGSTVYLPAGTYLVKGNLVAKITGRPIQVVGDGWGQTVISFTGSGDCFRSYCPGLYSTDTIFGEVPVGGGITDITIDGTNHTGYASAVHAGDLFQYHIDVEVQNFSKPNDKGAWFDNQYTWTEQLHGKIFASYCTQHVVFDNNNGGANSTGSFERSDLSIFIDQNNAAFDGVVFQNGTYIADGALSIEGNFMGSKSAVSSAVLRLTDVAPLGHADAGTYSNLVTSSVNIGVENDATSGNTPYTIFFGSSDNFIVNCTGQMDFLAAPTGFRPCNIPSSVSNFSGIVTGDKGLAGS
jgi:hypothetical protein